MLQSVWKPKSIPICNHILFFSALQLYGVCVVCGVWCVVCGVWFVVCGVWFVVCGVWCVVQEKLDKLKLLRMASSGMLCHMALVRTDVSEGLNASIIRVTRIGELGTILAVTSN
jgi:hypothetical protein